MDLPSQESQMGPPGRQSLSSKRMKTRAVTMKRYPDGYDDHGSFHSVLQDHMFRQRCHLVAIDELHLCASNSWGGGFRPHYGQLAKLRRQLDEHTRLFGTTATLTSRNCMEIIGSAGFTNLRGGRPIRTTVYRNDIFIKLIPTERGKDVCRQIVYTALEEAIHQPGHALPKMIFFVDHVKDTVDLQQCIVRWLLARGQTNAAHKVAWIYHGQLTNDSRCDIEKKFECGEYRILCATYAYAFGVNPPGVKYVTQWGRCSLEDALQKLGRANRGARPNVGDKAVFYWLPDKRVVGPLHHQVPIEDRKGYGRAKKRSKRPLFPGESEAITLADYTDSALSDMGRPPAQNRPFTLPRNAPDSLWREVILSSAEYAVYNSGCIWRALLEPFDERMEQPCCNCSSCVPNAHALASLMNEEEEGIETSEGKAKVRDALNILAAKLGNERDSVWMRSFGTDPMERVLRSADRRRFVSSYSRVAAGDLLGWSWARSYGDRVVCAVRRALHLPPLPLGHDPLRERRPRPAAVQIAVPGVLGVSTVLPQPRQITYHREALAPKASNIQVTARGGPSYIKHVPGVRGKKRRLVYSDESDDSDSE